MKRLFNFFGRRWAVIDRRTNTVVYIFPFKGQAQRCARNSNGLDLDHYDTERIA